MIMVTVWEAILDTFGTVLASTNLLSVCYRLYYDSLLFIWLTESLRVSAVTGPLKENQIAFVIRETLHGLQYLHDRGRMHRDVKVRHLLCSFEAV